MARLNINEVLENSKVENELKPMNETDIKLHELIPRYATNKVELDSYKKICDADNTAIKEIMSTNNMKDYTVGDFTAKVSTSEKTSMNEDKLLEIINNLDRPDLIKTKQYVDMDLLEKAMYNNEISADDLAPCITVKTVTTLRINKAKK